MCEAVKFDCAMLLYVVRISTGTNATFIYTNHATLLVYTRTHRSHVLPLPPVGHCHAPALFTPHDLYSIRMHKDKMKGEKQQDTRLRKCSLNMHPSNVRSLYGSPFILSVNFFLSLQNWWERQIFEPLTCGGANF